MQIFKMAYPAKQQHLSVPEGTFGLKQGRHRVHEWQTADTRRQSDCKVYPYIFVKSNSQNSMRELTYV